jgi:hypothetical protein
MVAVPDGEGGWVLADTLQEARRRAGKVQGRRTTVALRPPVEVPPGDWDLTLQTAFVEPAYLEPDASWCAPGGEPSGVLANGGAFGGKVGSDLGEVARRLADEHGRPVRVVLAREDVVRLGPKRPPIAAGIDRHGRGVIRVARTPGSDDLAGWRASFQERLPDCRVEETLVAGPRVSSALRGAGWVEAAVLIAGVEHFDWPAGPQSPEVTVRSPDGGDATVSLGDGEVHVRVAAGEVLDEVVLRSYCVGAVHQALGWVRSEGLVVDEHGAVLDLTIRSFGILPARAMPPVTVEIHAGRHPACNVSDAVFAATAAAAWISAGRVARWPIERGGTR